jgi:lipopolysaccharide/colanic/teichoic acid biosynthesis glycosyltransferase
MSTSNCSPETVERAAAIYTPPHSLYCRVGKRAIDLVVSVVGLAILSPLLLLLALAVKISSPGPVFFLQERVGRFGKHFRIVKFRSMITGADRTGLGITIAGDCRITKVGSILRWLKLDELPQLWNVACGDMSLVGPRPELPIYVLAYSESERLVLSVRPGITDNASIAFRDEEMLLIGSEETADHLYRRVILPRKLALSCSYIPMMSLHKDVAILIKTLLSVFWPRQINVER